MISAIYEARMHSKTCDFLYPKNGFHPFICFISQGLSGLILARCRRIQEWRIL